MCAADNDMTITLGGLSDSDYNIKHIVYRHNGNSNFLFLDDHVESRKQMSVKLKTVYGFLDDRYGD